MSALSNLKDFIPGNIDQTDPSRTAITDKSPSPTLTVGGTMAALSAIALSNCIDKREVSLDPSRVTTPRNDSTSSSTLQSSPTSSSRERSSADDYELKEDEQGNKIRSDGTVISAIDEDGWADDINWEKEILAELSSNDPAPIASYAESLLEIFHAWFVDSGAPEKGQKYVLSIINSLQSLERSGYDLDNSLRSPLKDYFPEAIYERERASWIKGSSCAGSFVQLFVNPKPLKFYFSAFCALRALQSADKYPNVRLQYGDFLRHLRNAFNSKEYLEARGDLAQDLVDLLENLCYDKFTSTCLFNYWDAFLQKLCGAADEKIVGFGSLADVLEEDNEKLHHTDPVMRKPEAILNLEKLAGTLGASFDPVGKSNVPKKRSQQVVRNENREWTIRRVAHGTPTIEGNIFKKVSRFALNQPNASISPEFLAYLRAAKKRGEKVLYVNLQQIKGSEADRSRALRNLQNDPEFANTFYCMSLPMDGKYFKSLVNTDKPVEQFKADLMGLFFDNDKQPRLDSPAKLPLDLVQRIGENPLLGMRVASEMSRIFDRVHQDYFLGESPTSPIDRQDFIMQFYSEITDYITSMDYVLQDRKIKDPDHADELSLADYELIKIVVQACKDNKDRGGSKNGIDEAKYILLTYPLDNPKALCKALHDLYVNTLGAYTIKFEEILPNRLIYLLSILRRYEKLAQDPRNIERIRRNQPHYFKVQSHQSAREDDNNPASALPTLETALTQKSSLEFIRTIPVSFHPIPEFHDSLAKTYIRDGQPQVMRLYAQLEKDFKREEVWVDGKLYRSARELFVQLLQLDPIADVELTNQWLPNDQQLNMFHFLCTLQQGNTADLMLLAKLNLTPTYADLKVMQKPTSPTQNAFIELRNRCLFDPSYLENVLHSLDFGLEGILALTDQYDWSGSVDFETDDLMIQFKDLSKTEDGKKEVLAMLHLALKKGHLPVKLEDVFLDTYKPRMIEEIYQTRIKADSTKQIVVLEQDLALVDSQRQIHQKILGMIHADPESATAGWELLL